MFRRFFTGSRAVFQTLFARIKSDTEVTLARIRRMGLWQFELWLISAALGAATGFIAYYFTDAIQWLTRTLYNSDTNNLLYYTHRLPWWWIVLVPIIGGLITGLILHRFTPDGRVRSMSHVIEAAALRNGRVEEKAGLASAAASFVTLSMGGSTGQEGPLVHLGGLLATRLSKFINATGMTARDLLACAAAAAVAASFNAPIAGIILAHEIILRHYSISSFTPITIASVMGTITGHLLYGGNFAEIRLFKLSVTSYSEIPAFLLLGLVSGVIAIITIRAIFIAEDVGDVIQKQARIKPWMRPMIAGGLLGLIAINYPHIIGIGYQTTVKALHGLNTSQHIIVLVAVKVVAVAITIGGRMGGGIFSPALMIGALSGLAFGQIAVAMGGDVGQVQLYALAGMAAVSAAVLGAPLSTGIIIFEMTQNWGASIAVMSAVSVASGLTAKLVDKGFFMTQLERRGLHIAEGPQVYLLATFKVANYVKPLQESDEWIAKMRNEGAWIYNTDSFEEAMPLYENLGVTSLLVLDANLSNAKDNQDAIGRLDYLDVLRTYSTALGNVVEEEHH